MNKRRASADFTDGLVVPGQVSLCGYGALGGPLTGAAFTPCAARAAVSVVFGVFVALPGQWVFLAQ